MSIRVVFLGTSGSVPTLKRSLPCVVVQSSSDQWMFDCGENVQHQMMATKVSFHHKMKIFISHLHGDHVLGLPGLLQTMALMDRKESLQIYGPKGLKNYLVSTKKTLNFGLTYPVEINEILSEGLICNQKEYQISAIKSNHSVEGYCFAFTENPRPGKFYPDKALALGIAEGELWSKLQNGQKIITPNNITAKPSDVMGPLRRGRKIIYTGDTKPFAAFVEFAEGADLIIHDCTFDDALKEKADTDGHSTPSQAASQAKAAQAKCLVLSHISARYPDADLLLGQAKKVFPNTILAEDYMTLELPLSEELL
ncbi:ribonuclease Z [Candidatus Bathycorpusculum sp.]|uniref:ribonuclease Z n=1 Tax=Candidatus Bathycorpusculum sp. TaxID=2994959 RepID=UPI00281A5429|nr:ribonuclease Z [Candidatus Termitimicrobium sp.]MCL2432454.1 ribonuclease Z [Candidatus Termitimicrobium sp.]